MAKSELSSEKKDALIKLINEIRSSIKNRTLNCNFIIDKIEELKKIDKKYTYDQDKYPTLNYEVINKATEPQIPTNPSTLADAYIWKQGNWKKYTDFIKFFKNKTEEVSGEAAVFKAFAKHIRDPQNVPIFDQHAFRAILGIFQENNQEEWGTSESGYEYLVNKSGEWHDDQNTRNHYSERAYQFYFAKINRLMESCDNLSLIDRLLMPLGKALKDIPYKELVAALNSTK